MTFMDTVYATRKRLGWTQAQLADALSVSRRTVIHWEQGTRNPTHAELITDRLRALEVEHNSRPAKKRRK